MHKNIKDIKKKYRTKRRTKVSSSLKFTSSVFPYSGCLDSVTTLFLLLVQDIDQIHDDLQSGTAEKLLNQKVDHDVPGSAQHYCLTCA